MQNIKKKSKSKIAKKSKTIKLVLTDVDGVLTDGGRYYSEKGEHIKKFHVRDGMGVNLLLRNKIKTVIITKENSLIVKKWSKEMNVSKLLMGIKNKESELPKICKLYKIRKNEIAYIGDDVNDIDLLAKVGFSACPQDSIDKVKKVVDYVCGLDGGKGVFREIADLILSIKFLNKKKWY